MHQKLFSIRDEGIVEPRAKLLGLYLRLREEHPEEAWENALNFWDEDGEGSAVTDDSDTFAEIQDALLSLGIAIAERNNPDLRYDRRTREEKEIDELYDRLTKLQGRKIDMVAHFEGYRIRNSIKTKKPFTCLQLRHIVCSNGRMLESAYLTHTSSFQNAGELQSGDIIYMQGLPLPFPVAGRKDVWNCRISNVYDIYLLNRSTVNALPDFSRLGRENENEMLVSYIKNSYPGAAEGIEEEWADLVSSVNFKHAVGARLYQLVPPQLSKGFRYEVNRKVVVITGRDVRDFKAVYIVRDPGSGKEMMIGQRWIDRTAGLGEPFAAGLFFSSIEKALRRAAKLNAELSAQQKPEFL